MNIPAARTLENDGRVSRFTIGRSPCALLQKRQQRRQVQSVTLSGGKNDLTIKGVGQLPHTSWCSRIFLQGLKQQTLRKFQMKVLR